jgi:hypothetical protein
MFESPVNCDEHDASDSDSAVEERNDSSSESELEDDAENVSNEDRNRTTTTSAVAPRLVTRTGRVVVLPIRLRNGYQLR